MGGPKVSIVTVSYNSQSSIESTIQSVVAQQYSKIEYIIVDGGSKDNTLKIVDKYKSSIAKVVSEKDQGIYDALNKGVRMATGDIIAFLHSDDVYADDQVIGDMVALFEVEKLEATYADLVYVDRDNINKVIRNWKSGEYKEGLFLKGWMPPHPTFFVKKEVYNRYGLFNLELRSAADYELMLRFIHKHQIKLGYLPRVIVKMRVGGMSNASIKNRIRANREDRKAWKINNLQPKPYTLVLKPLSKVLQYWFKKA